MTNRFTQETLLLRWNEGATTRAFRVLREGYSGGKKTALKSVARNWKGDLLVVRSPTPKREFTGVILLDHDPPDTIIDDTRLGSDGDLHSAWSATDLEVKGFEDADYWSAEPISDWNPQVVYDPMGNYRAMLLTVVEK